MCNDTTKLLLGIDDENLKIENGEKGDDGVIRLTGRLSYTPKACPNCGIINDQKIINYGWRMTNVRFSKTLGSTVVLTLNRRNFHCKECHTNFLAQTSVVPKNSTISNTTRKECLEKLVEPVSLKHIANELSTSDSFVGRQLMRSERDFQTNWHYLPEVILMDEVKSTKSATDAMSFEFMDGETHELIDLLPFRTMPKLEKYFRHYDQNARENVKIIVTDMNYTYPKLVEKIFPNAIVIIDRFHIVNALNRAFNKTRIRLMKDLATSSKAYRALKRYWKLLLVPADQLNYEYFHKWTNFAYPIAATDVVHALLSISPELKKTYEIMNQLRSTIKAKDWNNYNLAFSDTQGCSEEMITALETLQQHHDEIRNTFANNFSNGPLEGSNNKIKVIKRASFGYRNFFRFRARVLFVFRIKTKRALITK